MAIEPRDLILITTAVVGAFAGLALLVAFFWYKFAGARKTAISEDFDVIRRSADGYKLLYEQSEKQVAVLKSQNAELTTNLERAESALRTAKDELESALKQNLKLLGKIDAVEERIAKLEMR